MLSPFSSIKLRVMRCESGLCLPIARISTWEMEPKSKDRIRSSGTWLTTPEWLQMFSMCWNMSYFVFNIPASVFGTHLDPPPPPQRAIRTAMARKRPLYHTNLFTLFNRKEGCEPNDHLHGGLCGLPGSLPKIGSSDFKPLLKFFFTHTSSEFLVRMR